MSKQKCPLIVFTKIFPGQDVDQLIESAQECGFEGFDLCLRPAFPINASNVTSRLPEAQKRFLQAGVPIGMISGETNLLSPKEPVAEPILSAMDLADIRLLKLGYYRFDAHKQDYWQAVEAARRDLDGWQALAKRYNVKACVHTHMGMLACNCAALMHLLADFDPRWIGAYIDPCHMRIEGEPFTTGAAMTRKHLCAVGLKDVTLSRVPKNDHGSAAHNMGVLAGEGMVDWNEVFPVLQEFQFDGVLSAHCTVLNYGKVPPEQHVDYIRREIAFLKRKRDEFLK